MAKEESKSKALTTLNEYSLLGKSGLRVSPVCLGCMTFGESWNFGVNKEESKKVFDLYRSKGGNFFDTANAYTNGHSEQFLGEYLSGIRSEAVIATKYTAHRKFHPSNRQPGEFISPNGGGNGRKSMVESLDISLKSLGTGYIDVFYVHNYDLLTPIEEMMRSLDDCVRSGKALYVAVSDSPAWAIARGNTMAELRGWTPFVALQTRYNILDRTLEYELGPMAEEFGMTICPWGVLAEGFLTGKHTKDAKSTESSRNESVAKHFLKEQNVKILEEVKKIAIEVGRSPSQVSLNWVMQRPRMLPIFGAKNVAQLEDNLAALEFTLNADQMARLNAVSATEIPFPQRMASGIDFFDHCGLKVKGKPNVWF